MKPEIVTVRTGGKTLLDTTGRKWETLVVEVRWGWMAGNHPSHRVRVVLCSRDVSILIEHFDVHAPYGDHYGDLKDEQRVHLSALGCACGIAAHLEGLFDWQLRAYLRRGGVA